MLSAALPESLALGLAETSFTLGTAPLNAVARKGSVARSSVDSALSAALPESLASGLAETSFTLGTALLNAVARTGSVARTSGDSVECSPFGGVNRKCSPIYLLVGPHDSGTDDLGCAALGLGN